jgi:arylsulfatase A-like enzyme
MKNKISRRDFGKVTMAAGLAALPGVLPKLLNSEKRPNILFIFSDDHACNAIGAYGSKINETPNIDRIAADGVIFSNSFCTNSICAPSRAVVLSGQHSHINGVRTNTDTFDPTHQTYPKLLQKAGYQTAMIGKWHLKENPVGFDHWQVLPGQGHYYNPVFLTPEGEKEYPGYVTDITTDLALDWLENEREKDKPFMLHCWHKAPHRNWMPGPKHMDKYDGETIPEPPTLFDDYADKASPAAQNEMSIAEHMYPDYDLKITPVLAELGEDDKIPWGFERLTAEQRATWDAAYADENAEFNAANLEGEDLVRWQYQRYIKDYLRCIASVDDSVGQMLDYLDKSGLAENTIVIYGSDQGFYLGEHGWYDKRWMYEESLKMPLVMRWPEAIKPGQEIDELVQNIDYAPTLLAAAGLEIPADMQGASLLPLMEDEPVEWRKSIYYEYFEFPEPHRVAAHQGVRTERYKLIHFHATDEWEFYDLQVDPLEIANKYSDPLYVKIINDLKAELIRQKIAYKAD